MAGPPALPRRRAPTVGVCVVVALLFTISTVWTWSRVAATDPTTRGPSTPTAVPHTSGAQRFVTTGQAAGEPSHSYTPVGSASATAATDVGSGAHFPAQCAHLGSRFEAEVRKWIQEAPTQKELWYNCEADQKGRLCGGMGDRFRGMISVAYLAIVFRRRFRLYHPVPVPLEDFLEPNWVDWRVDAKMTRDEREAIPLNVQLMRLQQHGRFMRTMANPKSPEWREHLRLQSNSFGVDPYLHRIPHFSRRVTEELGMSPNCNITCYFSCIFSLLFRPSQTLQEEVTATFAQHGRAVAFERVPGTHHATGRFTVDGGIPFIGMQVRIGGSWASGFAVREPFRTPPEAVPHFFSLLKELRAGGAGASPARTDLTNAPIFLTSDAPRLLNMTISAFGRDAVYTTRGNGFCHTDSSHIGKINPAKWKMPTEAEIRECYLNTLASHYIVGSSSHVVMAQSGFGDTAFWRSQSEATALFVDMNNLRVAWQHHLRYLCDDAAPQLPTKSGRNCSASAAAGSSSSSAASVAGCGCSAVATVNRIVDLRKNPERFYGNARSA